jgi:predicted unusual protein kinase regulating ubiquinone biosynthesis (AarF/ABC1/UbiB family)
MSKRDRDTESSEAHESVQSSGRGKKVLGMMARVAGRSVLGKLPLVGAQGDRIGETMLRTMGELKGGYMKLGQILSYVDTDLSEEARKRLQQLCVTVEPMQWDTISTVIAAECGRPVDEVFAEIGREPVAAASIGQVHKARLADGTAVAVKIQYPEIDRAIENDVDGLSLLATVIGATTALETKPILEEMRVRFREECDYRLEARNQATFQRLAQGEPGIRVPGVIASLSSRRVLCTQWMEGERFDPFMARASEAQRHEMGLRLWRFIYQHLFRYGVFNADPHPGNYLFRDDELVLLDFGCVKHFTRTHIDNWKWLIRTIYAENRAEFRDATVACGFVAKPNKFDFDHWWRVVQVLYRPFLVREPFQFTAEFNRECNRVQRQKNPNLRITAMPPEWLFMTRLQLGLTNLMARFGTRYEFRKDWEALVHEDTQDLAAHDEPQAHAATA